MTLRYKYAWCVVVVLLAVACTPCSYPQGLYNLNYDAIRKSVVFLYLRGPNGELIAGGTGFLLAAPLKSDPKRGYVFLVTARHIADPAWDGCSTVNGMWWAVFNKADYDPQRDATGTIEIAMINRDGSPLLWHYPKDDSVDIALTAVDWGAIENQHVANEPFSVSNLPTKDELTKIDSGSSIASAGLLLGASGSKRNYPLFKFGNVSSIPKEKLPSKCCPDCAVQMQTEWLIAASLVGGNSGSPIFYAPSAINLTNQPSRAFLLGVQSTSFEGADVAGMAPVSYLIKILQDLNLPDVDLSPAVSASPAAVASPTTGQPEPKARPVPLPQPH